MKKDDYCEYEDDSRAEDFPTILTPAEVMDILGIGKNTVYRLLNMGRLQGIRIGRSWKIPLDSIYVFIDSQLTRRDGGAQ